MTGTPWWDKYITVLTQAYDAAAKTTSWHCYRYFGCFWAVTKENVSNSNEWYEQNSVTVRIPTDEPADIVPAKTVIICGDYDGNAEQLPSPAAIRVQYPNSIIVGTVRNNLNCPLRHIHITGA